MKANIISKNDRERAYGGSEEVTSNDYRMLLESSH